VGPPLYSNGEKLIPSSGPLGKDESNKDFKAEKETDTLNVRNP
jgi:hypothetical protein